MSVQSVSGASTSWQMLAEMRAARTAAADPATDGAQSSASSSGTQGSGASAGVTGAAPAPPPPSSVLQFFQQLQSVDNNTEAGSPDPSGSTIAGGSASDTSAIGSDSTGMLADLQSLLATLQQGSAGSSASVATTGSADPSGTLATQTGATQTGNDLALQLLGGMPGSPWQLAGGAGLMALGG